MAHFAKIGINNLVEDIVFVDNSITHEKYADDTEVEKEERGVEYLKGIFGSDTIWKQCSFNTWSN